MTAETKSFLDSLFADKPDDATILIWAKQGEGKSVKKISRWARNVDEALKAVAAAESEDGWDIYAGVCTGAKNYGANRRVPMAEVRSMPGVWADIDIAGDGHKAAKGGKKYPATIKDVEKLLAKIGLPPSLLVATGGGVHAYWLFREPLAFANEAERKAGADLSELWQRTIKLYAEADDYQIDSTFDLARVLRIPGTNNWKGSEPRAVSFVVDSALRYDVSKIREWIPPEATLDPKPIFASGPMFDAPPNGGASTATLAAPPGTAKKYGFILSPNAQPPQEKFLLLAEIETRFEQSTRYARKDMRDDSPSAYDLSLATFAAQAEWTDQEIVNLIIYCRNKNKKYDPAKMSREKYFYDTIDRARSAVRRTSAVEELRTFGVSRSVEAAEAASPVAPLVGEERTSILKRLSDAFGGRIQIKSVIKYAQDPPQYSLETGKGKVHIGGVDRLINQGAIRDAIAGTDGTLLPKFNKDDWEFIAQTLLDACEVVDTGAESTNAGAAKEWLRIYFDENPPADVLTDTSIANQNPHKDKEHPEKICFYLTAFRNWLYTRQQEKKSAKELGIILRHPSISAEPYTIAHNLEVKEGEPPKKTTRLVWRLPWKVKGD